MLQAFKQKKQLITSSMEQVLQIYMSYGHVLSDHKRWAPGCYGNLSKHNLDDLIFIRRQTRQAAAPTNKYHCSFELMKLQTEPSNSLINMVTSTGHLLPSTMISWLTIQPYKVRNVTTSKRSLHWTTQAQYLSASTLP